jgi:hypothetical protein
VFNLMYWISGGVRVFTFCLTVVLPWVRSSTSACHLKLLT